MGGLRRPATPLGWGAGSGRPPAVEVGDQDEGERQLKGGRPWRSPGRRQGSTAGRGYPTARPRRRKA